MRIILFPSEPLPFVSLTTYYSRNMTGISKNCDSFKKISTLDVRVLIVYKKKCRGAEAPAAIR